MGLPTDGRLWWLRWFDHPRWHRTTSTPHIELALSLLPETATPNDLPRLDGSLAARSTRQVLARVHTGPIPAMAIGMLFLGGLPIRLLETEARAFRFVRAECSVRVVPLRHRVDPASSNGSSTDEEDRPDFPLSRNAYTLARFDGWHCIHLRSITGEHQELVLPCCEAFRILYAPQRPIALALTNGPWEETFRMVVDDAPDRPTKALPDGSWHVSLAGGVTKEHAAVLANLVLDRAGRRAADQVWAAIQSPSLLINREAVSGRRPPWVQPGRLRAPIPFDWDILKVAIEGFRLAGNGNAWFGARARSGTCSSRNANMARLVESWAVW